MSRSVFIGLLVFVGLGCDAGTSSVTPGSPKLRVLNRTQTTVCEMYVFPEGSFDRGENRLGGANDPLRPSGSETVLVNAGSVRVELRDCAGGWVLNGAGIGVRGPTELVFYSGSNPGGMPPEGYGRIEIGMDSTGAEKRPKAAR